MVKEISIASGRKKFSIVVSNPLTKREKEPWELKEVDYLERKQLATITFEIYGR
ncbi:Uncharacterized protein dnl_21010 [Desulfonema limicola]|uniref:Uncharacterized protein n=2 Tax=Desulfonema limicola TaxID=45656 RepID=A0A975B6N8_9BACT|nr:Uncharacterized protein dnl_21010 [Desulfonema limicola]